MRGTWFVTLSLVFACVGCGSDKLSPAPGPAPDFLTPAASITGVVRDDRGDPIAGASVWADYGATDGPEVQSDANGRFSITFGPGAWTWDLPLLLASKPSYEPDAQQIQIEERVRDLTLHDFIRVTAGESVRVTVHPNDPHRTVIDGGIGAPLRIFDYRIRIVRLSAAVASRVTLRLLADDGGPAEFVVRGQERNSGEVTMSAGSEIEVEIRVLAGSASRTFTLLTTRSDAT